MTNASTRDVFCRSDASKPRGMHPTATDASSRVMFSISKRWMHPSGKIMHPRALDASGCISPCYGFQFFQFIFAKNVKKTLKYEIGYLAVRVS